MTLKTCLFSILIAGFSELNFAGEAIGGGPPSDAQIVAAQERGTKIRSEKKLLPEALMTFAAELKIKGVRCGHEYVAIEDAKGEGGAVYRYTERLRLVIPREKVESLEYTHALLLDADFALISGKQSYTTLSKDGAKRQGETVIVDMSVAGDTLTLNRKTKSGDEEFKTQPVETFRLLGSRPIPGKAMVAMPAFVKKDPLPLSGGINPFMVSTIYMGWSEQAFNIQSAWLSFDKSADGSLRMSARYLDTELSDQGLMVEAPSVESWKNSLEWGYDAKLRVTSMPKVSDAALSVEMVDPAKLDFEAVLDRDKINAALQP